MCEGVLRRRCEDGTQVEWGLRQLDGHAEGSFENKQIDFHPSKEVHFIVLRFNKSVVEHYQVTPHVR